MSSVQESSFVFLRLTLQLCYIYKQIHSSWLIGKLVEIIKYILNKRHCVRELFNALKYFGNEKSITFLAKPESSEYFG
jgi:hypothetical protein